VISCHRISEQGPTAAARRRLPPASLSRRSLRQSARRVQARDRVSSCRASCSPPRLRRPPWHPRRQTVPPCPATMSRRIRRRTLAGDGSRDSRAFVRGFACDRLLRSGVAYVGIVLARTAPTRMPRRTPAIEEASKRRGKKKHDPAPGRDEQIAAAIDATEKAGGKRRRAAASRTCSLIRWHEITTLDRRELDAMGIKHGRPPHVQGRRRARWPDDGSGGHAI